MFTFSWKEVATDSLAAELYAIFGRSAPDPSVGAQVLSLLTRLFETVGGVPISDVALNSHQLDDLAYRLLDDACCHALARLRPFNTMPGFYLVNEQLQPFSRRVAAHSTVPVNVADADELAELPEIGKQLAFRIIEGRYTGGPYSSPEDLADRILGIGPETVRQLVNVLSFAPPAELIPTGTANFSERFAAVAALARRPSKGDPVIVALDFLCTICAEHPHPSSVDRRRRSVPVKTPAGIQAEWIAPLVSKEYHDAMVRLFNEAVESIEVCMFHIALGNAGHPSMQLLQGLVAAVQRGVTVRVLIDRDRPTDPYNSTVVNRRAMEFLATNGVLAKADLEDRLLHSKFIVVDDRVVVVGSHNWSIGSFFEFDDVSLVVASPALAQQYVERFDLLWQE